MSVDNYNEFNESNFTQFINNKIKLNSKKNSKINLNLLKKKIIDIYDNSKINKTKKDYRFYLEQYTLVRLYLTIFIKLAN